MEAEENKTNYLRKIISESYERARRYALSLPKRFIWYRISSLIEDFLRGSEERLIIMPGLRGVGKTTILYQVYLHLIEKLGIENNRILFLPVDEIVKLLNSSIYEMVQIFEEKILESYLESIDKPVFLLIDEAHYDEKWAIALKVIYDKSKKVFILATGSSALSLTSTADLARRAKIEELFPLNFHEYLMLKKGYYESLSKLRKFVVDLIFNPTEIRNYDLYKEDFKKFQSKFNALEITNFLKIGGFPFSIKSNESVVNERIKQILERIVSEDLKKIEKFDEKTLSKVYEVILLLASSPQISIHSISKITGLSKETVGKILSSLEKCRLIFSVKPIGKEEKMVKKSWKYYFATPTIRFSLKQSFGTWNEEDKGLLWEEYVASILSRRNFSIFFDAKKEGADFVIKRELGRPIPVEVKFGKDGKEQVLNSMKRLNSPYGIIIGDFELKFEDNILYLPSELFLII